MRTPAAWMRSPKFTLSLDGVQRCSVRASTRLDEATFEELNGRLSRDTEFKTREDGMAYILSLGVSAYLSTDDPQEPT
jgi:hypothetical protein